MGCFYRRGPNKYTRNWEDEAAYNRTTGTRRKQFQNNREDFPALGGRRRSKSTENINNDVTQDVPKQVQINTINKSVLPGSSISSQIQEMNRKSFDKDKKSMHIRDSKQTSSNVLQSASKEIRIKAGEKTRKIKFIEKDKKIGPSGDAPIKKDGYRSHSEPVNNLV